MRRHFRALIVTAITVACVVWTLRVFDWHAVTRALARMDIIALVMGSLPILFCMFAVRGVRWLVVLGLTPTWGRFWQSLCANGAASGLASLTPFQLGEVIKIRMIPDHHGSAWRLGVSAFFLERVLDLAGVCGIGLCGLAMHSGWVALAPIALLSPLWGGLLLSMLAPLTRYLPARAQPYTELLQRRRQVFGAALLTSLLWLLYAVLWWLAVRSVHVVLTPSDVFIVLGGVMLAVVASMTPGGLGVAELGTRGVMLWLGASSSDADATAIALRLLTPLLAIAGAICMLALVRYRRRATLRGDTHSEP